jgi:hypothetical protein
MSSSHLLAFLRRLHFTFSGTVYGRKGTMPAMPVKAMSLPWLSMHRNEGNLG